MTPLINNISNIVTIKQRVASKHCNLMLSTRLYPNVFKIAYFFCYFSLFLANTKTLIMIEEIIVTKHTILIRFKILSPIVVSILTTGSSLV